MGKRVRISNSSLNSYGTRVLTEGVDLEQYKLNPILLWMHNRAWRGSKEEVLPLGYVKDIRVEGDDITGEPVFDAKDEFAQQIASKWEQGILKMVSPNFDIIAVDESPELALPEQTRATVTKCKLIEVSIVDIGGNDANIQLNYQGKQLQLSASGDCPDIPMINTNKKEKEMFELKTIALRLGLGEAAKEPEVLAQVDLLLGYKTENERLQGQLDALKLSGVTDKVNAAIAEGKLPADKKESMIALGKSSPEQLDTVLSLLQKPVRPTTIIGGGVDVKSEGELQLSKYTKLSEVPSDKLNDVRDNHKEEYMRLYRAEYGIDFKI